jgi:hypothetical protein
MMIAVRPTSVGFFFGQKKPAWFHAGKAVTFRFCPGICFLSGSRKILSRIHFVNNGFKSQGHAFAWLFYYQVPQESSSTRFVVKSSLTGLTLSNTQHPLTTRGESMYRMEKITTGAAYGASAGASLTAC